MTVSFRAAVVADPGGTLLALDFDGTLAHIVDDPTEAYAHERSVAALARLGGVLGQIAVVTGRPVRQALELAGFSGRAGVGSLLIRGRSGAPRQPVCESGSATGFVPNGSTANSTSHHSTK